MQHVFEFCAVKKLTPEQEENNKNEENPTMEPMIVRMYYGTKSSRAMKVADAIYRDLEDQFEIKKEDLANFYLRKLKPDQVRLLRDVKVQKVK